MVRLRRADGDQRVGALRQRVGDEEFELAGLVAAGSEAEQVVALDVDVGTAEVFRQALQLLDRRGQRGVAAAGKAGEVHGPDHSSTQVTRNRVAWRRGRAPLDPAAMRVDLFDFDLPPERIALHPARPRDGARLLHVPAAGAFADRIVRDLPSLLREGDLLVINDTRVIAAALNGVRPGRGDGPDIAVEINLHKRDGADLWRAFAKPGKRLRVDDVIHIGSALSATVVEKSEAGDITLRFDRSGAALDAAIAVAGAPPLPPYILAQRARETSDDDDYQTFFAKRPGAVAAPTAGLHFTRGLLTQLDAIGVERATVTLHVGAGTFLPVKMDDTSDHVMHAEWREIGAESAAAINRAKAQRRRVIAIGTTALRSVESAASATGVVSATAGDTDIFITPGYRFRVVDALWTNFHLPRSTLFMLVSAFAGLDRMRAAYAHAIEAGYRFYSFGDACFLEQAP